MVFREAAIVYDEKLDPVARKVDLARLISQKIAYFSNFVSPSGWSHAWMIEGIATILGTDAINKVIFLSYF